MRARDTEHLEQALERIRDHPGVIRTQTQVVLSTLFERPFRPGAPQAAGSARLDGAADSSPSTAAGSSGRAQ